MLQRAVFFLKILTCHIYGFVITQACADWFISETVAEANILRQAYFIFR